MTRNRKPLTDDEIMRRLRMMSHEAVLDTAAYTGRDSVRRFDAALAKRVLRERIAAGDVDDLDYERCVAVGVVRP